MFSCHQPESKPDAVHPANRKPKTISRCDCKFQYDWLDSSHYNSSSSICSRFDVPDGFVRMKNASGSFGEWLTGLPLLEEGTPVHLYNGELKGYQGAHAAVIDLDVGDEDLQQGIYAVIRLRAEYLFATRQFDQIMFPADAGLNISYRLYLKGRRVINQGNVTSENYYGKKYNLPVDHQVFSLYLNDVFRCAEDSQVSKQMRIIPPDSMQIGDVFLHVGNPGHAAIVVDMAINPKTGERVFMLAQSYRPAQQMHVLKNDYNKNISPWYPVYSKSRLITPEYVFDWEELKRF